MTGFFRLAGRAAPGIGVAKVAGGAASIPSVVSASACRCVADILFYMAGVLGICAVGCCICLVRVRFGRYRFPVRVVSVCVGAEITPRTRIGKQGI